ncbi:MAG: metal-dependent transcriptional regulator [Chloroflexi bacterium]|nr:metal-dependent transcriptional regulator [Chloroflexota bacterium]
MAEVDRSEEYMEVLYACHTEGKAIISARLAEYMGVTPPTVTETLRRLAREGYVALGNRKEITLTPRGLERAAYLVRRHRLTERWLIDVLGLSWAHAQEEACRLDHVMSEQTILHLSRVLGNPATCPHGNPIPGNAFADAVACTELDKAPAGQPLVVERVFDMGDTDAKLMDYLWQEGLRPGLALTVEESAPWAGTLRVQREGGSVVLGLRAASRVLVRPAGDICPDR